MFQSSSCSVVGGGVVMSLRYYSQGLGSLYCIPICLDSDTASTAVPTQYGTSLRNYSVQKRVERGGGCLPVAGILAGLSSSCRSARLLVLNGVEVSRNLLGCCSCL